jgi:hypothetical protein
MRNKKNSQGKKSCPQKGTNLTYWKIKYFLSWNNTLPVAEQTTFNGETQK